MNEWFITGCHSYAK